MSIVWSVAPVDLAPSKARHLSQTEARVELEHVGHVAVVPLRLRTTVAEPLAACAHRGSYKRVQLLGTLDRVHMAAVALRPAPLGPSSTAQRRS
jgi:hypothetical protein